MIKNLSVVIVNWNSNELVREQLDSLLDIDPQVIVVDNASDKSLQPLVAKYKNALLIENAFNRGFSVACNQGLVHVKNEWTLFLNPDVQLTAQNITQLLFQAGLQKFDAVSPVSKNTDYAKPVPTVLSLLSEFTFLNRIIPQSIFRSKTLIGGILCIRTNVIKNIGGFDERFFLWFEDSDLTKRLKDSGYIIGFIDTQIKHLGGYSLKKLTKRVQKDLFFNAMDVYSKKYFSKISQFVIEKIKHRFTAKKIIPTVNKKVVSIVVPNVKKELLDTFLQTNIGFFDTNSELIIVTNALDMQTIWQYRKKYSQVKFIVVSENYGFAHTVNIGFRSATGSFVGTCNDDVTLSKNWIADLVSNANAETGSINPLILNANGTIESAGITIEPKGKAQQLFDTTKNRVVPATNGACVIYSKEALTQVGIFDERFASYLEDIDLSLRLSKQGYENIVVPSVSITHLKHQTSSTINFNKTYHDFKNWILVILKNWSLATILKNLPALLLERGRNFSGMVKSNKKGFLLFVGVFVLAFLFIFSRLYKIETSLLFFNDIGRDFLVLFRWQETGKPPLLGPQTSALPYNQSAVYFYLLYPLYILSGYSPFATIYTAIVFYVVLLFFGFVYLRDTKKLQISFLLSYLLILIHPQFIIQNRFVWNPTFLGPLILLAFFSFEKLRTNFTTKNLLVFAGSISLAVSLNYSAAPLFIAFMIWSVVVFFKEFKFIKVMVLSGLTGIFWNLPTLFFELRHHFLLTNLLIHGEKLEQVAIAPQTKMSELLRYTLYGIPQKIAEIIANVLTVLSFITIALNKKSTHLVSSLVLLALTLFVIAIAPVSVQAHYIFAVVTMAFIIISLLDYRIYAVFFAVLAYYWLQPTVLESYIKPAYRSVEQTQNCAQVVCNQETEPLFISVQSDLHPYHNGMEFKYLFSQAGCSIKELDTQISEANKMAVIVDNSNYIHNVTAYNELTQFGESQVVNEYSCSQDLSVVILERN